MWQDFSGGELQAWVENMTWLVNMAKLLAKGVYWWSSFLGNLKPSDKKLGLHKTPYIYIRDFKIRVGLGYGEEVQRSGGLGEWSNVIGYAMGFLTCHGLHYNHDFFGGELQAWAENMTWLVNMAKPLAKGVFWWSSFFGQSQTLGQETWPS